MLSLRWGRIDFTRSSLYIAESMGIDKDERTRPKWQSARPLPMAPQLAHLLAAWGPDDAGEDDLVFPSPLGGKLDGSALRRRFVTARDKAGLQPLPFHAGTPSPRSPSPSTWSPDPITSSRTSARNDAATSGVILDRAAGW